jgi:hypothetical protein
LGSSALTGINTTQDPVKHTIDRLKNAANSTPYELPLIELAISINGIQFLNYKNKVF